MDFALCGECWRETPFITGLICDACGTPLPGEEDGKAIYCDTCLHTPPPWDQGRAALLYAGVARRLVLGLKHGDHLELVSPMASWMVGCAKELVSDNTIIAPVPLHPRRLLFRRFNQSAMLAAKLAENLSTEHCPDLLVRKIQTPIQDGLTRGERFENQHAAFKIHPKRLSQIKGRSVLLVDDVMTTGATLSACAKTCTNAGAASVNIVVLARVARGA